MNFDLKGINQIFKNAYSDKFDMMTNPTRAEEYKLYLSQRDKELEKIKYLEKQRQYKIDLLEPLKVGKYKIKALKDIEILYGPSIKQGKIRVLYNAGPSKHTGSLNGNQDSRAIIYDHGMSGVDQYYPTIDFEILEYLGDE